MVIMDNSCRSLNQATVSDSNFPETCEFYPNTIHLSQASTSSADSLSDDSFADQETLLFSKSRDGSIHVQKLIEKASTEETDQLIDGIVPIFEELSKDKYANYAVQSLIKKANHTQRLRLLDSVQTSILDLSFDAKGTHAIQCFAELIHSEAEEKTIYEQIKGNVNRLATDPQAIYVLLKLLKHTRYLYVREMIGNVQALATHKVGICAIKVVIRDPQILNEMLGCVVDLMVNPFGNYAIQLAIEFWREEISFPVKCAIKGKVVQLCTQKFASNVIETCLKVEEIKGMIVDELKEKIKPVIASPYGAYVVKSALQASDHSERSGLIEAISKVDRHSMCKNFKAIWDEVIY